METDVADVVEAILTAILQWRVSWLIEQKKNSAPPPICRTQPRKLKITYDSYKDYESTFVPLLMHEIWAQIFEEWTKIETELNGGTPMEVDGASPSDEQSASSNNRFGLKKKQLPQRHSCARRFPIGVIDYRSEKNFQIKIRCQHIVEASQVNTHLKLVGEGDLVCLDLAVVNDEFNALGQPQSGTLSLFAYVADVSSERITNYTDLSECFGTRPRNHFAVNYQVIIAKRPLRLNVKQVMRMTALYYLKPMIRQIESVALLKESALASDILCPKVITCQLSVPTIVSIKSPHYNDMQYKAIIGANEALVRNIPKIQLIQGPPGTGKTHTLIGIIKHFYSNLTESMGSPKILICAPSNGAIDEVGRRLYKEREFLKRSRLRRSLRMVRVGHPDQINDNVKAISLDELVEANAKNKIEGTKKKHTDQLKEIEDELSKCDTEITNLRFSKQHNKIPDVELKIARLMKKLEAAKASGETAAKRELSEAAKRQIRYELIKNSDVILTTLNSCQRHPLDSLFRGDRAQLSFHCVIVDEASQCCEPELLMPLCYRISKMILIGDPMQLPATVISRYAADFDFGRSLFERFFTHFGNYNPASPIAMLTDQYRMHPDICSFPSKQFYDNRLISARDITSQYPITPYLMFDLRHSSESKANRVSLENEVEADFVRNLLVAVLMKAPENSKIGVITPYKGQKRLITNKIESLKSQRNTSIDVNTCDGFQGQEKDIIILSCVRASDASSGFSSIGFLRSYQRVNVALTRAKHSLIICISTRSLSKDTTWKALIDDAVERRFIHSLTKTPSSVNLSEMIESRNNKHNKVHPSSCQNNYILEPTTSPDPLSKIVPEYVIEMDID